MNGFLLSKEIVSGKTFWIIRDLHTQLVIATGDTALEAVKKAEEYGFDGSDLHPF